MGHHPLYQCGDCNKVCKTAGALERHKRSHRSSRQSREDQVKGLTAQQVGSKHTNLTPASNHDLQAPSHSIFNDELWNQKFSCQYCCEVFPDEPSLNEHRLQQINECLRKSSLIGINCNHYSTFDGRTSVKITPHLAGLLGLAEEELRAQAESSPPSKEAPIVTKPPVAGGRIGSWNEPYACLICFQEFSDASGLAHHSESGVCLEISDKNGLIEQTVFCDEVFDESADEVIYPGKFLELDWNSNSLSPLHSKSTPTRPSTIYKKWTDMELD